MDGQVDGWMDRWVGGWMEPKKDCVSALDMMESKV